MITDQIWELFEFLNKQEIHDKGLEISFTSKSCPDYEIIAECVEDDDSETGTDCVWKIAINSIPYDENSMTDWFRNVDDFYHPYNYRDGNRLGEIIHKRTDWSLTEEDALTLVDLLSEARQRKIIRFDDWRLLLCNPLTHSDEVTNEND